MSSISHLARRTPEKDLFPSCMGSHKSDWLKKERRKPWVDAARESKRFRSRSGDESFVECLSFLIVIISVFLCWIFEQFCVFNICVYLWWKRKNFAKLSRGYPVENITNWVASRRRLPCDFYFLERVKGSPWRDCRAFVSATFISFCFGYFLLVFSSHYFLECLFRSASFFAWKAFLGKLI